MDLPARLVPLSFGSVQDGAIMRHFVVEARGTCLPARDGTVLVTLGLVRSLSLFQVLWRLVLLVALVAVAGSWLVGGVRFGGYVTVGPSAPCSWDRPCSGGRWSPTCRACGKPAGT